jgi:hypothetical protein
MGRKAIEKKRGVHFQVSSHCLYVEAFSQTPLQSQTAALLAVTEEPCPATGMQARGHLGSRDRRPRLPPALRRPGSAPEKSWRKSAAQTTGE